MDFVHDLIFSGSCNPGCYPTEGVSYYIRKGQEIPDYLLPGRPLMNLKKNSPMEFERLVNANLANVAPWWIKVMCGK